MCIILVANTIWYSGLAIRSSFLLDSTIIDDVSSQFSTSQLRNMIVQLMIKHCIFFNHHVSHYLGMSTKNHEHTRDMRHNSYYTRITCVQRLRLLRGTAFLAPPLSHESPC